MYILRKHNYVIYFMYCKFYLCKTFLLTHSEADKIYELEHGYSAAQGQLWCKLLMGT